MLFSGLTVFVHLFGPSISMAVVKCAAEVLYAAGSFAVSAHTAVRVGSEENKLKTSCISSVRRAFESRGGDCITLQWCSFDSFSKKDHWATLLNMVF